MGKKYLKIDDRYHGYDIIWDPIKKTYEAVYPNRLTSLLAEAERDRLACLNKPFAGNPPELTRATRVEVLKPICVGGKRIEIGETVNLPAVDAASLAALGKCKVF